MSLLSDTMACLCYSNVSLYSVSMLNQTLKLKQRVMQTESPSRDDVVSYFKALAAEAKTLPVNKRDGLASEILVPFTQLANPPEDDEDIEYIVFQLAGGYLDVMQEDVLAADQNSADESRRREFKAQVWRELIARIDALT